MKKRDTEALDLPESIDLTETDVLEAMKEIPGYLDITPRDFKEIYSLAYRQARSRLFREVTAADDHDQRCGRGVRRYTPWPKWLPSWEKMGFPECRWWTAAAGLTA